MNIIVFTFIYTLHFFLRMLSGWWMMVLSLALAYALGIMNEWDWMDWLPMGLFGGLIGMSMMALLPSNPSENKVPPR